MSTFAIQYYINKNNKLTKIPDDNKRIILLVHPRNPIRPDKGNISAYDLFCKTEYLLYSPWFGDIYKKPPSYFRNLFESFYSLNNQNLSVFHNALYTTDIHKYSVIIKELAHDNDFLNDDTIGDLFGIDLSSRTDDGQIIFSERKEEENIYFSRNRDKYHQLFITKHF